MDKNMLINLDEIESRQSREGNKNRLKNKVARFSRKGDSLKVVRAAKKNTVKNRKRKNPLLSFNKNLDPKERKHRIEVRETRRKARGLKPLA